VYIVAMPNHRIPLDVRENGEVFFEGRKCSTRRSPRGYQEVRLPLHRLVAHAFHGPPPTPKHICHHKDGNPHHNSAENLCWLTQAENTRKYFAGRPRKLTHKQIADIMAKRPGPNVTLMDLANSFGVSYSCVRAIRSGVNWKKGWKPHNRALLTPEQIAIVRQWQPPPVTAAGLARKYHVSDALILSIWHGRY
jgi:hypothetical protein